MLSPDPVKRSINPYPYCDNDPVNYNDPTGEIANILVGAGLGGFFGGAAGFLGNAASQLMDGGKFNWRKAAGAAANGAVVGAAKGALVGSGVGVLGAFATDFAAGTVGSALEQGISRGRVDIGESLLSGAGNALSEVLYGTGELKGVKDAFLRGARTGAVMSGIDNIARAAGIRGTEPGINPGGGGHSRGAAETAIPGYTGRDPKGMCGAADPFDLSSGLGNGRGYHSGRTHGGAGHSRTGENGGFSLGGFVRAVLTGAVTGGLGSAGFYGAGKAVDALWGSVAGRRSNGIHYTPVNSGPLKRNIAETFAGGSYTKIVLKDDAVFYRVYGGDAGKVGRYMTRTPQNGGMQTQIDLALVPDWGNTAEYITKVVVPKGTIIYEGRAALQAINGGAGQLLGGGNQIYIPEVNPLWFVN